MHDDKKATDCLAESVGHSISEIERGLKASVFPGKDSAYRDVATELRKLLVDRRATASFQKSIPRAKHTEDLLELPYGTGQKIRLQSFCPPRKTATDNYVDIPPNIYRIRADILSAATHGGPRVSLRAWLDEHLAYTRKGQILKVGTAIKHIAGREGSHIINPGGEERENIESAFVSEEPQPEAISNIDFNQTNPWRQLGIDAGMRLLEATCASGDRLLEHTIDVPETSLTDQRIRMQRKRRK